MARVRALERWRAEGRAMHARALLPFQVARLVSAGQVEAAAVPEL